MLGLTVCLSSRSLDIVQLVICDIDAWELFENTVSFAFQANIQLFLFCFVSKLSNQSELWFPDKFQRKAFCKRNFPILVNIL